MTPEAIADWKVRTEQYVRDPQPGDYFSDMMCPVALIEKRDGQDVKVRKPNKERDAWGPGEWMTLADFVKWLSYGSIPGFWVEGWRDAPTVGAVDP